MKVLVTGGAGFIGFSLAKYLANCDYEVTICDDFSRGSRDRDLQEVIKRDNVQLLETDLTDRESLHKLDKDYDYAYHLAAINGTRYFYEIPHTVLRVNLLTLINILDWAINIDLRKFVFTSSPEAYAAAKDVFALPLPTPEEVPLVISDVYNPRYSYAGSKIVGELLCLNYARQHDMNLSIVRPSNVYGPREGYEHVIPEFIMRIIKKEDPFKIYGGNQTRAFCYIDDFVRGIKLAAESERTNGEVINIGNDKQEMRITDLAQRMFELFDYNPRKIDMLSAPKGSPDRRCPDISKARNLLGYEPQVDLDEGLKEIHNWYLKEHQRD